MAGRYNPEIHRRQSIRLKGYEYSRPGTYFVTICARNRQCLFGNISDGQMVLNDAGRIIERVWKDLPTRFPSVELDAFGVMPNHVHGIIAIVGAGLAPPKTRVRQAASRQALPQKGAATCLLRIAACRAAPLLPAGRQGAGGWRLRRAAEKGPSRLRV